MADPMIRTTVLAHRDDQIYLQGAYRGQVNGEIRITYNDLRALRGIGRSEVHGYWRHLRHHGDYGYRDSSGRCLVKSS